MVPLSLPQEDRRVVVRSFWFLMSAIFGLLLSLPTWLAGVPIWLVALAATLIAVVAGSLVLANERFVRRLYHAWNNRIIQPMSSIVTSIVVRICLWVVFALTGRAGSKLRFQQATGSLWLQRERSGDHTTMMPFVPRRTDNKPLPNGWSRNYVRWAIQSGNAWAIFLLPFFWLLRMVSAEEETSSGANIYTLF